MICARARLRNRWRFPKLLPLGLSRRSMMFMPDTVYPACLTRMYHSTKRRTWRSVYPRLIMRSTKSVCFRSVSESFLLPKLMTAASPRPG